MAEIIGESNWSPVRQLETHELARGGLNGNMNEQAKALVERTNFLKEKSATKEELATIPRGYFKSYETLAEANLDIANIPLNVTVRVLSIDDGGDWYKKTIESTELTRSPYDPTTIVNEQNSTQIKTYFSEIEKNLDSVGLSFIDSTSRIAGNITPKGGSSLTTSDYTYIFNNAISATKKLKSILFQTQSECEFLIKVFTKSTDKFIYSRTLQKVKSLNVGFNYVTFLETAENTLQAGEYLGISLLAGNSITYELLPKDEVEPLYFNINNPNALEVPIANAGKKARIQIGFYSEIRSNIFSENIQNILNQINDIKDNLIYSEQIYGCKTAPVAGTNANPAQWIIAQEVLESSLLTEFKTFATKSGTLDVCVYSKTADKSFSIKSLKTVNVVQGVNVFSDLKIDVSKGDYLGIRTFDSGLTQYTASTDSTLSFPVYSHSSLTSNTGFSGPTGGYIWQFNFKLQNLNAKEYLTFSLDSLTSQINDLKARAGLVETLVGSKNSPTVGTNANSAQWIIAQSIEKAGKLTQFKTYSTKSGVVDICVYSKSGANNFSVKSKQTVNVVQGANTFSDLNLEVSIGDYLGIKTHDIGLTQYIFSSDTTLSFPVYSHANLDATTGFAGPTGGSIWQFNFLIENTLAEQPKKWVGKKYVSFGDSITWYNGRAFVATHVEAGQIAKGYQSYVVDELGCTLDNKGESGWDMTQIYKDRILPYDFSDTYLTTITSGANDCRKGEVARLPSNSVRKGEIAPINSTFDIGSFTGALQASIEHVYASNPACKIVLITPIRGWYNEFNTNNVPNTSEEVLGLMDPFYAQIIKEIGQLYSIPVVDWYNEVGINDLNKSYFIGDDPTTGFTAYELHPNQKGFKKMGELLVPVLKQL